MKIYELTEDLLTEDDVVSSVPKADAEAKENAIETAKQVEHALDNEKGDVVFSGDGDIERNLNRALERSEE